MEVSDPTLIIIDEENEKTSRSNEGFEVATEWLHSIGERELGKRISQKPGTYSI